MDKTSTYGLDQKRLARLLSIGAEQDAQSQQDRDSALQAEVLHALLHGTLPLGAESVAALPVLLGRLRRELLPAGGRELIQVILDPATDSGTLGRIKEYGRAIASHKGVEAQSAAGTTIYYAAIAAALVHHGLRMTRHSHEALSRSFDALASTAWVPRDLVALFLKARDEARRKAEPK